jgi:hypothetical protein
MITAAAMAVLALTGASATKLEDRSLAWTAAWLLPAAGLQLVLHESAHALVPALRRDPRLRLSFSPDRESRTLATTRWTNDSALADGLASAAPKVLDLTLMLELGRMKRRVASPWARGLLSALQVTALADFLQGTLIIWRPPSRWNDAWYLSRRLESSGLPLGRNGARAAMTAVALGGVLVFMATW